MKKKLVIPRFKNKEEECEFWEKLDLSKYAANFQHLNLDELLEKYSEPTTTRVTIRIPTAVVKSYKDKAGKLDIPYQSLMKQQLAKGL